MAPEALGIAVAHGDNEQLAVAEGIDANRHHHRSGADLQVSPQDAVEVGGVALDVGERVWSKDRPRNASPCSSRPWQMLGAPVTHHRFGDAAGSAQRLHLGVAPAAWLQPVRGKAALPESEDWQGKVADLGGEQPQPIDVAVGEALVRAALKAMGAGQSRNLSLQQVLEAPAHDLRNKGASGTALHELSSEAPRQKMVMVCVRFVGSAPIRDTDRPIYCHSGDARKESRQPGFTETVPPELHHLCGPYSTLATIHQSSFALWHN